MNLWKTFEKLNKIYESKQDIENFINKFGQDTYDLFIKSKQRLKNKAISTDLVWHTKNTSKKDLDKILYNLENRIITKADNITSVAGDYEYLGEDKGYKVYYIKDHIAAMNFGAGTGWCISGRYDHYNEPNYIPSESKAKEHFSEYTGKDIKFFFFIRKNDKYALALYPETIWVNEVFGDLWIKKTNFELWNEQDKLDYKKVDYLPLHLIPDNFQLELYKVMNNLKIQNNEIIGTEGTVQKVIIPDSVISIGDNAFAYCENLTNIELSNNIRNIGKSAFSWCSKLTNITIPNSVTSIGAYAFSSCKSLTNITLGKNITNISSSAFSHCSSLENITIPESVTNIGDSAFENCASLSSIILPEGITNIGKNTFYECTNLVNIKIPNSVETINDYAFDKCSSLTNIIIPNNTTSIGYSAFSGCNNLTNVVIGNNVSVIKNFAFNSCNNLTSIIIPESVTFIGDKAFSNCKELIIKTNNEYVINYCIKNNIKYESE